MAFQRNMRDLEVRVARHPKLDGVEGPKQRLFFVLIRDDTYSGFHALDRAMRKGLPPLRMVWHRDVACLVCCFLSETLSLKVFDAVNGVDAHFVGWFRLPASSRTQREPWPPTNDSFAEELVHQTIPQNVFPFLGMETVGNGALRERARRTTPFMKPALCSYSGAQVLLLHQFLQVIEGKKGRRARNNRRYGVRKWKELKERTDALQPGRMTHRDWVKRVVLHSVNVDSKSASAGLVDGVMILFDGATMRRLLVEALGLEERHIWEALDLARWIWFAHRSRSNL